MDEHNSNRPDGVADLDELEITEDHGLGLPGPNPRGPDTSPEGYPPAPERIGPYRILEVLGRGGMGIVYLAEQTEPVRRRVALKMMQRGLGNRGLQARFEAERHAMARLHHPNVAQMYDAGSTDTEQPYFVMELVEGLPATDYCDRKRLRIRERLELFQAICQGVQHAHEKGLLHRDLKPANILVAEEQDEPVPKILDFGIAKAIDRPLVEGTLFTGEQVIGTPAYLCPEAVETVGIGFDLDTRSDVYSLGILLYELLVGVRPFETSGIPFVQVLRNITDKEPAGPSSRWTTLEGDTQTDLAKKRHHDTHSLSKRLKGDLDWIVLKAIAKDRRDRYPSAADLAADIQRHLDNQPVEASPPSAVYRAGKFVRRRRGLVAAVGLLLISLLAGLLGTLVGLTKAKQEAVLTRQALEETKEVSRFLGDLLEVFDPGEALGNTSAARELLERGAERIEAGFVEQPLTRAQFMLIIGDLYQKLGLYEQAEPLLEEALAIREKALGPNHSGVAQSLNNLGHLYERQGRYDEAEPVIQRSVSIREETLGPNHPDVAQSLNNLGGIYERQGRYDEAEHVIQRSVAIREEALGLNHPDVAQSLDSLGHLYHLQGRYEEGVSAIQRSLTINENAMGPDHPDVAQSLNVLAILYGRQGRYDEAQLLLLRSLAIREKALGSDHPAVAQSLMNIGFFYGPQERFEEAEPLYERAIAIFEKAVEQDHPRLGNAVVNLGVLHWKQGRLEEAESELQRAIQIYAKNLGVDHVWNAEARWGLAGVYRDQGRYEDAEPLYQQALAIQEQVLARDNRDLRNTLTDYAQLLRVTGREEEALELEARAEFPTPDA